jgi:cytochrome b subunit of formate dehydrogenase
MPFLAVPAITNPTSTSMRKTMKRTIVNYCIDVLMLIALVLCGITGIVKWPGLILALGLTYKDIPMAAITAVHDWSGLVICILAMTHICMHWKWIVTLTRQIADPRGDRNE